MPRLGEYLEQATGTFSSPNHPVPLTGQQLIDMFDKESELLPITVGTGLDPLDIPIEAEKRASGDVWIYPADRSLTTEGAPYVIHHPALAEAPNA